MAGSILVAPYRLRRDGTEYQGLGSAHFARRDKRRGPARLVRRLTLLGYAVDLRPAA